MQARAEDIREAERLGVWTKVRRDECPQQIGKPPLGTRWVDTSQGDDSHPQPRSRSIARELKSCNRDYDLFVATPPIEFITYLISHAASRQYSSSATCLLLCGVKNAFLYAPATQPLYVELTSEALGPGEGGMCGRIERSLYGTRAVALDWSIAYTNTLLQVGFGTVASSPGIGL